MILGIIYPAHGLAEHRQPEPPLPGSPSARRAASPRTGAATGAETPLPGSGSSTLLGTARSPSQARQLFAETETLAAPGSIQAGFRGAAREVIPFTPPGRPALLPLAAHATAGPRSAVPGATEPAPLCGVKTPFGNHNLPHQLHVLQPFPMPFVLFI